MNSPLDDFAAAAGLRPGAFHQWNDMVAPDYRFRLEGRSDAVIPDAISMEAPGRFGNAVLQLIYAIYFAQMIGVKQIFIPPNALFGNVSARIGDMTFTSGAELERFDRKVLRGNFFWFGQEFLQEDGLRFFKEAPRIAKAYIPTLLHLVLRTDNESTLSIHFRAGDVFEGDGANVNYTQPPLAYYIKATEDAIAGHGSFDVINLVFEDKKNPCIDAFAEYLNSKGISFKNQSGSLSEDVETIYNSDILISSFGTFCPSISLMSSRIVHYYSFRDSGLSTYGEWGGDNFHLYKDDGYLVQDSWKNTPEQRAELISFPLEKVFKAGL